MRVDEIIRGFDVRDVSKEYEGEVVIDNLREKLGTRGNILVIRGDKALYDELSHSEKAISTPKLWIYEGIINLPEVRRLLEESQEHGLFDGVGYSGLAALGFHARRIERNPVAVFAREFVANPDIVEKYGIEVIYGILPMEEGYVKAQEEVIKNRKDIIPLHQAMRGARAIAPVGNKITRLLDEQAIRPDLSFWCIASGASLFGIGGKLRERFGSKSVFVEPSDNLNLDYNTDFSNPADVIEFARTKSRNFDLVSWAEAGKKYSGVFPLHVSGPNRYLLAYWRATGDSGFDDMEQINVKDVRNLQSKLKEINPEYDWTQSTALTLFPAIKEAKKGRDVLVMCYGKNRETPYREIRID